jgi:hypothetical protein
VSSGSAWLLDGAADGDQQREQGNEWQDTCHCWSVTV